MLAHVGRYQLRLRLLSKRIRNGIALLVCLLLGDSVTIRDGFSYLAVRALFKRETSIRNVRIICRRLAGSVLCSSASTRAFVCGVSDGILNILIGELNRAHAGVATA